jgi:iron complex transport system substrate-binding protein
MRQGGTAWVHRHGRLLLFAAAALFFAVDARAAPQRVASIYLCADVLLVRLAERERIVSLTRFAADPALSPVADTARGIAVNRGRAEDILPLQPDLVIAGAGAAPATRALLRRLGARLLELPLATDFDDIRANIGRVAEALETPERGAAMIAAMDLRLAATRSPDGRQPRVLFYRGGYVQGRGTLLDAMMTAASLDNHGAALIGDGVAWVSLEALLLRPPEALLLGGSDPRRARRATGPASHPALRRLVARLPSMPLSDRAWHCGWPEAAAAVEALARFRDRLLAKADGNRKAGP